MAVRRTFYAEFTRNVRFFRIFAGYGLSAALARVIKPLNLFDEPSSFAMSAKFYFYFFWHLRPLADREGC